MLKSMFKLYSHSVLDEYTVLNKQYLGGRITTFWAIQNFIAL